MAMLQDFERTTTARLLLRRIQEGDLDAVFAIHADPETSRFDPSGPLRSMDAARELMALWLGDWARHGVGYWVVERLGMRRDRVIGLEGVANAVYLAE